MRKLICTAGLALLLLGCENAIQGEAEYEGVPTSGWVALATDRTQDVERRRKAVKALGELGLTETDETVPALAEALTDPDEGVRYYSLLSLEKLAPKAAKAQPAVGRAMNDKNRAIAKQAIRVYRVIEMARPSALNGH
jgi:HEAT repeat protein